jgi:nicotinamide-nucleotide amidase
VGIEEALGRLLAARGCSVAVAESCTGGLFAAALTSVSGSSAYMRGGVVAYADEVKVRELDVDAALLRRDGAVSEAVARQMAGNVRRRLDADIGLGITGIAGPEGGTPEKPVGLVYVGLSHAEGGTVRRFEFEGDRANVRAAAVRSALEMLHEHLRASVAARERSGERTGGRHGQEE